MKNFYLRTFFALSFILAGFSAFAQPTFDVNNIKDPCNGIANGSFEILVTGGEPEFSVFVFGPSTLINGVKIEMGVPFKVENRRPGKYDIYVVEDNSQESEYYELNLTSVSNISIDEVVKEDNSCEGASDGSIALTVSGGTGNYLYSLDGGTSFVENPVTNLAEGTYVVTVFDQGTNCSEQVSVEIGDELTISITDPAAYCNDADPVDLRNFVDPSVPGGTFVFTGDGVSGNIFDPSAITVSSNGAETVEVGVVYEVNGCSVGNIITIVVNELPSLTADLSHVLCKDGNEGAIDISMSSGKAPFAYHWSNGETTEDISGLEAGDYEVVVTDSNGCAVAAQFTITEPDALSLTEEITPVGCFNESTGAIALTVTGGTTDYSYSWSNGATTKDISGLAAGDYTVTVTDANDCNISATYSVPNATPLSVEETIQDAVCNGDATGAISLEVSGGSAPYSYSWNHGATTKDISGLAAGSYTVTITDSNGCDLTTAYNVGEPAALILDLQATDATSCDGEDGTVDLSVEGGAAPYSYSWSNGETTEDLSGLAAGTYTVTLKDANNCEASSTVTIGEPAGISAIHASTKEPSCYEGEDGAIVLTVEGGEAPYSYAWSNGATTKDISDLATGTYTVDVTDARNCKATLTVELGQPEQLQLDATVSAVSCHGAEDGAISVEVSGGTADYRYSWSNGASTAAISGLAPGTYTVDILDASNCSLSASFTVEEPAALALSLGELQDVSSCEGADGSINISVNGGTAPYTYSWSNGAETEDVSGLAAGDYAVSITDANGCTFTEGFTISAPAGIERIDFSIANVNCFEGEDGAIDITVIGGEAPYTYVWSNGADTEDVSDLAAGEYSVEVTDAAGCMATASFTVEEPTELILSFDQINVSTCGGEDGAINLTVTGGSGPYTYAWDNGADTEDISDLAAGTYTVAVTDANGCETSGEITITEPEGITHVEIVLQNEISCAGAANGVLKAEVTGGSGKLNYLWSNDKTTATNSNLAPGVYEVTVTDVNNCSFTASYELQSPAALNLTAVLTDPTCEGKSDGTIDLSVDGGVAPYTYSWSNGTITEDLSNVPSGTYEVTVTDANGCTGTESYTLSAPAVLNLNLTVEDASSCVENNGSINLEVSGGSGSYQYAWSNGATTQDISGLAAGSYTVVVTDEEGCEATATASVSAPEGISSLEAVVEDASCNENNGSIMLSVTGGAEPFTYAWSNGAESKDLDGLVAGEYSVEVTDANGCTAVASFLVNGGGDFDVNAVVTDATCAGNEDGAIALAVSGGAEPYAYSWSNGAESEDISGLAAGTYSVTITDANGCSQIFEYHVGEPAPITVNAVVQDISCAGESDGAITLELSGGTGNYTFSWSDGADTQDRSDLAAGTYQLEISDENACEVTHSYTIAAPQELTIFADISAESCAGEDGAIDLTVSGGTAPYNYAWNTGAATEDLVSLETGTYTVIVSDGNGCSQELGFVVESAGPITLEADVQGTSCHDGTDGTIALVPGGGEAPYTYSWSNGATSAEITGLPAGDYTVTVTDAGGCEARGTYTITAPEALVLTAAITDVECSGNSNGAIVLTASGGSGEYSYAWEHGATTADLSGLSAGTYTVTVTDANGCTATEAYTVTANTNIVVALGEDLVACEPAMLTLDAGYEPADGYSIEWNTGETSRTIEVTSGGTYAVRVTHTESGCFDEDELLVTIEEELIASVSIEVHDAWSCNSEVLEMEAVATYGGEAPVYRWFYNNNLLEEATGSILSLNEFSEGAEIRVELESSLSCVANSPEDTYIISLPAAPTAALEDASHTICAGEEVGLVFTFTGTAPFSLTYTDGTENYTLSGLEEPELVVNVRPEVNTNYSLVAFSDAGSCEAGLSGLVEVTISEDAPAAPAVGESSFTICEGSEEEYPVFAAEGVNLKWYLVTEEGNVEVASGETYSPAVTEAGSYTYLVTQSNNCGESEAASISFTIRSRTVCETDPACTEVPEAPVASSPEPVCEGEANPVVTAEGVNLKWYLLTEEGLLEVGTGETYSPEVTEAGDYTYYVTQENACGESATTEVSFTIRTAEDCSTDPVCENAPVVDLGDDIARCAPAEISLDAGYEPGELYSVAWTRNGEPYEGGRTISVEESGYFTVTVTALESGCASTDDIQITIEESITASVTIRPNNEMDCEGGPVVLEAVLVNGGENPTYTWLNKDNEPIEGQNTRYLELTEYEIGDKITVLADVNLECATENPVRAIYTINTLPQAPQVSPMASTICEGENNPGFTATGTNLKWYAGSVEEANLQGSGETFVPQVTAAGTYTYLVTQENSCGTSEATQLTFTIWTADECASNGFDCGTFSAILIEEKEPSCDLHNGEMHYEISGGTAPYFVRYTFAGDLREQVKNSETFSLDILNIPADDTVRLYVRDAYGRECTLKNVLEMAPRITVSLTKSEDGDISCFGEQAGKARLVIEGGNAPFQYLLNSAEGWVTLNGRTKDFTDLPAGVNSILVRDSEGDECYGNAEVEIRSLNPQLRLVYESEPANCNDNTGKIWVREISGGNGGPYKVKLQSEAAFRDFEGEMVFDELARGAYKLVVTDGSCEIQQDVRIGSPGLIAIEEPEVIPYNCDEPDLKARLFVRIAEYTEVDGPYEASIFRRNDDGEFALLPGMEAVRFNSQNELYQDGLDRGTYRIEIRTVSREGCPENYNRDIVIDNPDMPTPITFNHEAINIFCADSQGGVQLTNLRGERNMAYTISVYADDQLVKERVISREEYLVNNGSDGVFALSGLNAGIYRLVVSQDQGHCDRLETSEAVAFRVEEKDQKLFAEVTAKTESFPERGSGSLTLTVRTNSGQEPYLSSIYLVDPLFPGQYYESEGDEVIYDAIEATFKLTYTEMPAGKYEIYITDANGCSVVLEETIEYDQHLFIPNVITPNGDGYNDFFYVRNIPDTGTRLTITNRWGKVVFTTDNYANNWDGGNEPDGVYFYNLLVVDGEGINMKGYVEIKRGGRPR